MKFAHFARLVIVACMCTAALQSCSMFEPQTEPVPTLDEQAAIQTIVAGTLEALPKVDTPVPVDTPVAESPTEAPAEEPTPVPPQETPTLDASASTLRVVYVKDGNIWLWREAKHSSIPLTSSGNIIDVRISGDGQVVAYVRQLNEFRYELWAVNTEGEGGSFNDRMLVGVSELGSYDPKALGVVPSNFAWIPGTHTLAYNTFELLETGISHYDDLRLVNADTLEKKTLFQPGQGGHFYFSPDGHRIALVTPTRITLVNSDGSGRLEGIIAYEMVSTYSEYNYYAHPIWSTDSQWLRVAIPPAEPMANPPLPTTLWAIPAGGPAAVPMGTVAAAPSTVADVVFSPDFSHIAFLRQSGDPSANQYELHIANPDGSGDTLYFIGTLMTFHGWGKDPSRFAFSSGDPSLTQLGRIGAEYFGVKPDASNVFDLRWVDAARYLYVKSGSGFFELRLNDLAGNTNLIDTTGSLAPVYDFAP